MIAYVDSSVFLRIILRQPEQLREWNDIGSVVTSALSEVECLRTLDRLRFKKDIPNETIALLREAAYRLLEEAKVVEITRPVLGRASQALPVSLRTLDSLHLSTALLWAEKEASEVVMATHDAELAVASRACGLRVIGV